METVLQRAKDYGITLNRDKCQFGVQELELCGYRFTSEGLKPTNEKCRAVKECSSPNPREEVRSFLGMIGYLSKFIPRYAVLTAPLRRLTRKDVPFSWGPEELISKLNLISRSSSSSHSSHFSPVAMWSSSTVNGFIHKFLPPSAIVRKMVICSNVFAFALIN